MRSYINIDNILLYYQYFIVVPYSIIQQKLDVFRYLCKI